MRSSLRIRVLSFLVWSSFVLVWSNFALLGPAESQPAELVPFEVEGNQSGKISIFQEIPGFADTLFRLDQQTELLAKTDTWSSMSETDIWVFFLKNSVEASLLPDFVLEALRANYDGSPTFAMIGDVSVGDSSKERLMYFVFINDFPREELSIVGCDVAILLYDLLEGNDMTDIRDEQQSCLID